jgi:hypothetical protein
MNEQHFLNGAIRTHFSASIVSGSKPDDYTGHDPTNPTPPPPPPVPPG